MWCARLSLSRPGSAVVVRVGRNWATFGSPFFLCRVPLYAIFGNAKMLQNFSKRNATSTFTAK